MKKIIFLLIALFALSNAMNAQRRMENLGRGLMAVKITNGVYVNWRITGQEWRGTSYNIYRDDVKINDTPITGASNYVDANGTVESKYKVSAIVDSVEQTPSSEVSVLPQARLDIKMKAIPKIAGVDDTYYNAYTINDVVAGDLDGDGEYELIVKRVNNAFDSSEPFANKYNTLFDAYKLDGTFLWRIDIGPNIFNNVEQNAFVYDLDGDGKAEVVMRTSEGTVDGIGDTIPDLGNAEGEDTPDGITNYRDKMELNSSWYEFKGPEYLSLFDGATGAMLDRIDIIARQPVSQWGTSGTSDAGLAHRADKFHYGAPYLDGKRPSLLVTRGIYYRTKMATYDIVNKKFVSKWTFDSGTGEYASQGYHNYFIADMDDDGRDEIAYGSMVVDDDGNGLYSTGLGHGDAIHVGDFDPYRKGLEVFACLENSPVYGTSFRQAEDGVELYHYYHGSDCGRCMAANVSNSYAGAELWPTTSGVYSASERKATSLTSGSVNFRIYWDGDLLDELVDHNFDSTLGKGVGVVQKLSGSSWTNLLQTDGYYSCNYTKGTPCLQADLFGDWREELIYRDAGDSTIAIFMTTIPTDYRIYTLMHDMQYREAIGWQMCGYNQPPYVSYFLGEKEGITVPPPPVFDNQKLVFDPSSSTSWGLGTSNWTKDDVQATLQDGDDVLFDVSGHADGIQLTNTVSLKTLTVNSPNDYSLDMSNGKLSGSMIFVKQGEGALTFNGNHDYSGTTEIWDGLVNFDGTLSNSPVWVNLFGELAAKGTLGKGVSLNYGSVLYPGGKGNIDTLSVTTGNVVLDSGAIVEIDIDSALISDKLNILSDSLIIRNGVTFRINTTLCDSIHLGDYVLGSMPYLSGDLSSVTISGLSDKITSLSYANKQLILSVKGTRASSAVTWTGKNSGYIWNFATDYNFTMDGSETFFVEGDTVKFDDSAVSKTVNVSGTVIPAAIEIDNTAAYVFQGDGVISGTTGLSKTGSGRLTMMGSNDFTGAVNIKGGILFVESMPNLTNNGSIGVASDDPDLFVLDGAIFTSTGSITSERAMKIGSNGGTISANAAMYWKSIITGGTLTKAGSFGLTLYSADTNDTLKIKGGTITLATDSASPGNNVVITNGTLSCTNSTSSSNTAAWNIIVPSGGTGTINLDGRCYYTGSLTGDGTLNVYSPYVRSDLKGDWSAFSGKINFTGSDIRMNTASTRNLANATVDLGSGTSLLVMVDGKSTELSGQTFYLGSLSGSGSMSGKDYYYIGNKNLNSTYSGVISAGSGKLTKVGTGAFTLSGSNLYTGATTINGGELVTANTTGSATGTGAVAVNSSGTLSGTGIVSGLVTVNSGGIINPGISTSSAWADQIGTLTLSGGLTLTSASTVSLSANSVSTYTSDLIAISGNFTAAGNLSVTVVNGSDPFPLGAKLTLFDLTNASVSGAFTSYTLPTTAANTSWDTSNLLTEGYIEVVEGSGITSASSQSFNITPNPAHNYVVVSDEALKGKTFQISFVKMDGGIAYSTEATFGEKINIADLTVGAYLVKVESDGTMFYSKLLKK